jgi:hypothetical protein
VNLTPIHVPVAFSTCENESEPMAREGIFLFPSSHSLAVQLVGDAFGYVLANPRKAAKAGGTPNSLMVT